MSSNKQPVALAKAYRLLNHGLVTLVSSAASGQRNVMAASWVMPLDFDPPKVAVVIDRNTLTRELIEASGEFALNIPCRSFASQTLAAGSISGREHDKFAELNLLTHAASQISAPLLDGCIAWLECRILDEPQVQQRYDLFLAEVVAAWALPEVFGNGHWQDTPAGKRTIHYQAGGAFFSTGESFSVSSDDCRQ